MTEDEEARAAASAKIVKNRTVLVRTVMEEQLLACLDETDLWHLRRAEMGLPLVVLEWNQYPDGSGQASLAAIEAIIEKLLTHYDEAPAEPYAWPDLRGDLRQLQANIDDLREALSAGQTDNAIGRAIAVGTGIGRLGFWLFAGADAAGGAKNCFDGIANGCKGGGVRLHEKHDEVCEAAIAYHRKHPSRKAWFIAGRMAEGFGISRRTIYPWLSKIIPGADR